MSAVMDNAGGAVIDSVICGTAPRKEQTGRCDVVQRRVVRRGRTSRAESRDEPSQRALRWPARGSASATHGECD